MRRLLTILTLLLGALLAPSALAAPVDQARAAWQSARSAVQAAAVRQSRVRQAHESVARQINARKAAATNRLPGVGDGTLDALLKRAHDLSAQLEAADRAITAARRRVSDRRQALVRAIDAQLALTNRRLATGSDTERRAAFAQMQSLASERARLMAAGQVAGRETVRLPAVADGASADELRELADEASDNAERVRSQLAALEARLSALNARKLMLRAANAFDTDTSLFAEDERNRQLARAERPRAAQADGDGSPTVVAGGRNQAPDEPQAEAELGGVDGPGAAAPPAEAGNGGDRAPEGGGGSPDPTFDTDADGVVDDGALVNAPPPSDAVMPEVGGREDTGGAVVFETALDPALLSEDVDALSPAAVADQLRALRKKQADLRKAAAELARRRAALEKRAENLEKE